MINHHLILLIVLSLLLAGCVAPRKKKAPFPEPPMPAKTERAMQLHSLKATDNGQIVASISKTGAQARISWTGGATGMVFQLRTKSNVLESAWRNVGSPSTNRSALVPANLPFSVYTVQGTEPAASSWPKKIGGAVNDRSTAVVVDGSGNIYLAGYFSGTADFGGINLMAAGNADMFLAKYSSAGALVWAKRYGGPFSTVAPLFIGLFGNNLVVAGHFTGSVEFGGPTAVSQAYDIFLAGYTTDGSYRFSQRYGGGADDLMTAGGIDGRNGDFFVAGTFNGTVSFGGPTLTAYFGGTDCFLAKYSNTGTPLWSKNFNNISSDRIAALAVDGSGNIALSGTTDAFINFGGGDLPAGMFLAKLTQTGSHTWSQTIGNATPKAIATDSSGNIVLTGIFGGTINLGGGSLTNAGNYDVFYAKYTAAGNHSWSKRTGGANSDNVAAMALDASGNIYLSGNYFYSTLLGGLEMFSQGQDDIFQAKYNSSGNYVSAQSYGGTGTDVPTALTVDGTAVVSTGVFQGTALFNGQPLTSSGANDVYLLRQ